MVIIPITLLIIFIILYMLLQEPGIVCLDRDG